jgi:hypothetical protein
MRPATITLADGLESFLNEGGKLRPLIFEGFGADRVGNDLLWFLEQSAGRPGNSSASNRTSRLLT